MKVKIKVVEHREGNTGGQRRPGRGKGLTALRQQRNPKNARTCLTDTGFHLDSPDFLLGIYFLCLVKASDPIPGEPILYSYNKLGGNVGGFNM